MGSLIIALAMEAGKVAAAALAAHGHPGGAQLVTEAGDAALRVKDVLAANTSALTGGDVTAEDVHAAFDKAHAEARGLVDDARKNLGE